MSVALICSVLGPNWRLLVPGWDSTHLAHTSPCRATRVHLTVWGLLQQRLIGHVAKIGFSQGISIGEAADVAFGDFWIGWRATPRQPPPAHIAQSVRAQIHVCGRAAARNKPVLVVQAGRVPSARARGLHNRGGRPRTMFRCGHSAGGMLLLDTVLQLFDAVETRPARRPILVIVAYANAGGPGVWLPSLGARRREASVAI